MVPMKSEPHDVFGSGAALFSRLARRIPGAFVTMAVILLASGLTWLPAYGAAKSASGPVVLGRQGAWAVTFDPRSSTLDCLHTASKTRVTGRLTFAVLRAGAAVPWSIQPARDSISSRLAIVNPEGDVQGYVTIIGDGNRLAISALPRPRQTYKGELRFFPETSLGTKAFACRTRLAEPGMVVQMASGPADSLLNNSIFDPERDLVLGFGRQHVKIETQASGASQAPTFRVDLAAGVPQESATAPVITIEMLPDYYRARYVPDYRLIDRKRCPTPPTGWMSWNAYFDVAGEKENLEEARFAARYLKPFGLDIWSIESWQENSLKLPVSNFHNLTLRASPEEFPHGMKWLAGEIRALGFKPGIWTVPFGTGDADFYQTHRDWFLHDAQGQPMTNWCGRYLLDPSLPQVRKHMEETHRTMSSDWGYEFFKIDGMSGASKGYSAHFYERPEVHAAFHMPCKDPYRLSVEALRRGIGPDRIFLACQGHYSGPDAAYADASRLGSDIVHPGKPPHWENYLNQAR
ncbi:MAG: alpha-galactosidase, partial [Bryobacteraceae bacterium]